MNENNGDNLPIYRRLARKKKDRQSLEEANKIQLELTSQATEKLRRLVLRDNPNLAEFPFLGLGKGLIVNDIWVVDEDLYSKRSGLLRSGFLGSRTDRQEVEELFRRISADGRIQDLILLGHLHPSGETVIEGRKYIVSPSDMLLNPSGGDPSKGGSVSGGDLASYNSFLRLNPTVSPYAAITANTQHGPQLRAFDIRALTRIRRYSDIDRVPQITLPL